MFKKRFFTVAIVALFATMGTLSAQEKYAILIGGNMNPDAQYIPTSQQWNGGNGAGQYGFDEFWNDTYLMWEMLVFTKEFTDANVHVLFGEGDDFTFYGQDERYTAGYHYSYEAVTDDSSTYYAISTTFSNLASTITEDDFLFVWIMSHGGTNPFTGKSYFYSYDNQKVYDDELATWLGNIAAHKKVVFLSFPKSGGFVSELEDDGTIVITSSGATQSAGRADNLAPNGAFIENEVINTITYNHGEINYHLFSSLTGKTPVNQTVYSGSNLSTVDVDSDSFVDINEAWNWTSTKETLSNESPVLSDQDNIKSTTELTYPTLLHANISSSTNVSCRGLIGISKNVTVPGTSGLQFLDDSKIYFLNDQTELEAGSESTLIIRNNCDFIGTGTLNFITITSNIYLTIGSYLTITGLQSGNFWIIDIDDPLSVIELDHAEISKAYLFVLTGSFELTNATLSSVALSHEYGVYGMYINNTTFTNSRLDIYASDPVIENCTFTITSLDNPMSQGDLLTIENCPEFSVDGCDFINAYESGIVIYNSGTDTLGIHEITGSSINDCGQMVSTAAGILCYNSHVDIFDNIEIEGNPYGIKSLNNSEVSITGDRYADYVNETQQIYNNDENQVYATDGAFPYYVRWNAIYDEDNDCLVMYDTQEEEPPYDVSNNYWGVNFDPEDDLCPDGYYTYSPVWYLQIPGKSTGVDEEMFNTAGSLTTSGNYYQAKATYQELVATFPSSNFATASLKELFALEPTAGNNYASLKNYYLGIINQHVNNRLTKSAEFLANRCDIALSNYQNAISWYEGIIANPPSFADSLFAIIDLGYLYIKMEEDSLKSTPVGTMTEYKPVTKKHHSEYRDYLLSLLFKDESVNKNPEIELGKNKAAELLPNIPNPFCDKTTIQYAANEAGYIRIKISDFSGRIVSIRDEGWKEPGQYQLALTSENLVSGVYFCTIESNGMRTDSQKISVMK